MDTCLIIVFKFCKNGQYKSVDGKKREDKCSSFFCSLKAVMERE